MLQLGDVLMPKEDVRSVSRRGDRLRLVLRWRFEELPLLLDLPRKLRLTWHGDDDLQAGVLVRAERWSYRRGSGDRGEVSIVLSGVGNAVSQRSRFLCHTGRRQAPP